MGKLRIAATRKPGAWRRYWTGDLPPGAEALGIVHRDAVSGALLRLADGEYVQGVAGELHALPQEAVNAALAAAALGALRSKRKADAARTNGRLWGGRPRKT